MVPSSNILITAVSMELLCPLDDSLLDSRPPKLPFSFPTVERSATEYASTNRTVVVLFLSRKVTVMRDLEAPASSPSCHVLRPCPTYLVTSLYSHLILYRNRNVSYYGLWLDFVHHAVIYTLIPQLHRYGSLLIEIAYRKLESSLMSFIPTWG